MKSPIGVSFVVLDEFCDGEHVVEQMKNTPAWHSIKREYAKMFPSTTWWRTISLDPDQTDSKSTTKTGIDSTQM